MVCLFIPHGMQHCSVLSLVLFLGICSDSLGKASLVKSSGLMAILSSKFEHSILSNVKLYMKIIRIFPLMFSFDGISSMLQGQGNSPFPLVGFILYRNRLAHFMWRTAKVLMHTILKWHMQCRIIAIISWFREHMWHV